MTRLFERCAGYCALLAALASIVFTVAFAVVVQDGERWAQWVSWVTLSAGGLITIPVMAALYEIFKEAEPQFSLVGFVLGVAGALGATIHGAFDLSLLANPPVGPSPGLPNAIDPRGLMTFGITGLALLVFAWLMVRTDRFPRNLGSLAAVGSVLLLVVYVGRLTVLNPKTNVIRVAALGSGLVVLPAFYLLLSRRLLRGQSTGPQDGSAPAVRDAPGLAP
jgi:hypothetical protein